MITEEEQKAPVVRPQESASQSESTESYDASDSNRNNRQNKRLTLSFPILSPTAPTDRQTSPSPGYSTPAHSGQNSPRRVGPALPSPVDSTGFLTSLAAQERKVLELKEELQRAETELTRLKKQWANYEANKKTSELRHVEQLQSYPKSAQTGTEQAANTARIEQANRLDRPIRKSQQRVFSGSTHTRTLSLLSPTLNAGRESAPKSFEEILSPSQDGEQNAIHEIEDSRDPRAAASDPTTFSKTYKDLAARGSLPPQSRDAIVKTGKQMASDIREGLWTFFEDIRQATVGEEGINGTENRATLASQQHSSRTNPKGNQNIPSKEKRMRSKEQLAKRDGLARRSTEQGHPSAKIIQKKDNSSFWQEFGLETPNQKGRQDPGRPPKDGPLTRTDGLKSKSHFEGNTIVDDDHWDLWDSPIPVPSQKPEAEDSKKQLRHSNSTVRSRGASDSNADTGTFSTASPRTSTSSVDPSSTPSTVKNTDGVTPSSSGGIPWPEITKKMHPYRLSRTISDLVKDWEIHDPDAEAAAEAAAQQAQKKEQNTSTEPLSDLL